MSKQKINVTGMYEIRYQKHHLGKVYYYTGKSFDTNKKNRSLYSSELAAKKVWRSIHGTYPIGNKSWVDVAIGSNPVRPLKKRSVKMKRKKNPASYPTYVYVVYRLLRPLPAPVRGYQQKMAAVQAFLTRKEALSTAKELQEDIPNSVYIVEREKNWGQADEKNPVRPLKRKKKSGGVYYVAILNNKTRFYFTNRQTFDSDMKKALPFISGEAANKERERLQNLYNKWVNVYYKSN